MTFEKLAVDLDGAVATIVLNRPDKANAIDHAMWHEIRAAMRWLDETPAARIGDHPRRGKAVHRGNRSRPARRDSRADRRCVRRTRAREAPSADPRPAGHADLDRTLSQAGHRRDSRCVHRRRRRPRHRLRHPSVQRGCGVLDEGNRGRDDGRPGHAAAAAAARWRRHGARARLYRTRVDGREARESAWSTAASTPARRCWPARASSP